MNQEIIPYLIAVILFLLIIVIVIMLGYQMDKQIRLACEKQNNTSMLSGGDLDINCSTIDFSIKELTGYVK